MILQGGKASCLSRLKACKPRAFEDIGAESEFLDEGERDGVGRCSVDLWVQSVWEYEVRVPGSETEDLLFFMSLT